jgi:molybdopterin-synthase adenylyltransferase
MNRYNRHISLVGEDNFDKIRDAVVLVAGVGGLGCSVIQLLARFGFGTIHVFDPGIIDIPDLNRQILYDENDLGKFKAEVTVAKLKEINSEILLFAHKIKIENDTSFPHVDIVIDCLDNFQDRLVLENLFFDKGIPVIHAGVSEFFGQITTLIPGETHKLSEVFGKDFMLSAEPVPKDIFPPVVMNVASIQVSEAIKLVCNMKEGLLVNKMMIVDLLSNNVEILDLG